MSFENAIRNDLCYIRPLLRDLAHSKRRPLRKSALRHAKKLVAILGIMPAQKAMLITSRMIQRDNFPGGFGLFANVSFLGTEPAIFNWLLAEAPQYVESVLSVCRSVKGIPAVNCGLVLQRSEEQLRELLRDDANWNYLMNQIGAQFDSFEEVFDTAKALTHLLTLLLLGRFIKRAELEVLARNVLEDWRQGNWFCGVSVEKSPAVLFWTA